MWTFQIPNESAVELGGRLRIPIELLQIKIKGNWKNFKDFNANITIGKREIPSILVLSDILLDTGNETNYCIMSSYFLDVFKSKIYPVKTISKITESMDGQRNMEITLDSFEFQICNACFSSQIGFCFNPASNWLNTINFGINSIRQFTSVLFLYQGKNYYYCTSKSPVA